MTQFFKKFYSDFWGLVFTAMGIFTLLSLYSYTPNDPSFNSFAKNKVVNYCGVVGSFYADSLLQIFGVASWLLAIYFIVIGIKGLSGQIETKNDFRILPVVINTLIFCSLVGLHFSQLRIFSERVFASGFAGYFITKGFVSVLNPIGAGVFLWFVLILNSVFITETKIRDLIQKVNQVFAIILEKIHKDLFLSKRDKALSGTVYQTSSRSLLKKENKESNIKSFIDKKINRKEKQKLEYVNSNCVDNAEIEKDELILTKSEERDSKSNSILKIEKNEAFDKTSTQRRKVTAKVNIPQQIENWQMPNLTLLEDPPATRARVDKEELRRKAEQLTEKFRLFNVEGLVVAVKSGPAVTMLEFKPNADVKLSAITSLENDLAIALSSESLRIIAPIPGRDVVGIESSNSIRETVYLKDLIAEENFWKDEIKLPIALGKQTNGDPQIVDLRKMPHLLVAGSTGSGKSVFTVSLITGLIFKHSPKTLKLIMVDPKQVDLAAFAKIPHLLMPPIVDTSKAVNALRWAVKEMDKRYRSMSKFGARGLEDYNDTIKKLSATEILEHQKLNEDFELKNKKNANYYYQELPYIVVVVEEFGDLMQIDSVNVEQAVVRLAQLARACGIHLILCMQSPRKEIVTGLIKTNIPGRISFKVASKMDSRIILDESGAERLLARGDMLFRAPGTDKPMRHHGPWVSDPEIAKVARFWSDQAEPIFDSKIMELFELQGEGDSCSSPLFDEENEQADEMYDQIVDYVSNQKEMSASLLQRKYRLGYPRAARIIEIMEREGVVGPPNGSKPRQVLIQSFPK
jgi:S-DNA-T family DNA segregation ATPase FtsK/SpoIIIE